MVFFEFVDRGNDNWLIRYESQEEYMEGSEKAADFQVSKVWFYVTYK